MLNFLMLSSYATKEHPSWLSIFIENSTDLLSLLDGLFTISFQTLCCIPCEWLFKRSYVAFTEKTTSILKNTVYFRDSILLQLHEDVWANEFKSIVYTVIDCTNF